MKNIATVTYLISVIFKIIYVSGDEPWDIPGIYFIGRKNQKKQNADIRSRSKFEQSALN